MTSDDASPRGEGVVHAGDILVSTEQTNFVQLAGCQGVYSTGYETQEGDSHTDNNTFVSQYVAVVFLVIMGCGFSL